ncbi:MAG: lipid-A-disaccharide synthase [Proteobacteria bacterium]|nr:lipid-A-disaccharide synthase [Pseudomonadota bacterium]
MSRPHSIFIIAGEPSGDVLGARLIAALRELTGGKVEVCGVGGEMMREQGLESIFPMEELSVMGIAEILPHLPRLLRRIRETAVAVDRAAPDALVTIDSPDFTRRVVRRVTDRAIPRIHFVAPTVWAWRPWRAKGFARDFTHLLALLPFEPAWFESVGLPCDFVGHPVIESGADKGDGAAFRARHGIAADAPVVCVLPGSRRGEIVRLAGDFGSAVTLLAKQHSGMRLVVPTVEAMAPMVRDLAAGWPGSPIVLQGAAERYDAMAASNAALAASGTVALELALARVPTVVAYRVAPLTHFIVRRLLSTEFGNLINIIEDREIVPELIQGDCRPDRLVAALERMLGPEGVAQTEAMQPALSQLGLGGEAPSRRAAQAVLDIIARSGT